MSSICDKFKPIKITEAFPCVGVAELIMKLENMCL